jgi:hypothetical protein
MIRSYQPVALVQKIPPSDGGDIVAILDHLADEMESEPTGPGVPTILADGAHIPPARVRFLAGVVRSRTETIDDRQVPA